MDDSASFVSDAAIQNALFPILLGNATITIGGNSETITHIWLDDDGGDDPPADDFGIRVATVLGFNENVASQWTGAVTVGVDLNQLIVGTYVSVDNGTGALPRFHITSDPIQLTIAAIPEPSTALMLSLGLAGLAIRPRIRP